MHFKRNIITENDTPRQVVNKERNIEETNIKKMIATKDGIKQN